MFCYKSFIIKLLTLEISKESINTEKKIKNHEKRSNDVISFEIFLLENLKKMK